MSGALNPGTLAIGAEEFADLLRPFLPLPATIAVAVSGGADSMALALCLKRWGQSDMIALIVDHALRPESAGEAESVKAALARHQIAAEIIRWAHAPVTARLHEQARNARYDLLTQACHRHGIGDLFVAHHRDDQAETILMRLCKGSGVDGLAGMSAQSERNGIRLLRPFLALGKDRLIATCVDASVAFINDPSNHAPQFARGRLRAVMPMLEAEGLTVGSLIQLGQRAAESKKALDHYAGALLREAFQIERGGSVRFQSAALSTVPRAIALRALTAALRLVYPDDHPPDHVGLSAVLEALIAPTLTPTRTFYGCIVSVQDTYARLLREPFAATHSLETPLQMPVLWDKRWWVGGEGLTIEGLRLTALGEAPHDVIDRLAPPLRRLVPQGRVRASLPALWKDDTLAAIPSFDTAAPLWMRAHKEGFPFIG